MNWNLFLGHISAFLFFVPPIIILITRLFSNPSWLLLGVYCLLNALHGLMEQGVWAAAQSLRIAFATVLNYLDTPFMLLVLLVFCFNPKQRRVLWVLVSMVGLYEVVVASWFGLERLSTLLVSGPGLVLVFCCSLFFFVQQLRQTIEFGKGLGRTVIAAAIFFVYGCYTIIYCFYYLQQVSQVADVFLLYHFASSVFCLLSCFGLLQLGRQHRRIRQLQVVRRELAEIY